MINNDRIVPITAVDLLTNYATTLKIVASATAGTVPTILAADDTEGNFTVGTNSATVFCNEPVKSVNFGSGVSAGTVYFVAGTHYDGFAINGTKTATAGATVDADGTTLYSATLSSSTITVAKVGF